MKQVFMYLLLRLHVSNLRHKTLTIYRLARDQYQKFFFPFGTPVASRLSTSKQVMQDLVLMYLDSCAYQLRLDKLIPDNPSRFSVQATGH